MTYSFPNLEPVHCSMSSSNCCFLVCIQVSQEAGNVVWYTYLIKNIPQFVVNHTVKGFSIVNEADVSFEFRCFLHGPTNVSNLISGSSSFSKPRLIISNFLVRIMLKPSMQDCKHDLTTMGDECNCPVFITFFSTILLGNWDED